MGCGPDHLTRSVYTVVAISPARFTLVNTMQQISAPTLHRPDVTSHYCVRSVECVAGGEAVYGCVRLCAAVLPVWAV